MSIRAACKPFLCKVAGTNEATADLVAKGKKGYPFADGDIVLMLGEIDQMPGHVVIATGDGKIIFGYHREHFRRLRPNEC